MLLELKDINKSYFQGKQEMPVLKNVNFSVEEGEYVAIMGPSGSGKSTLMNNVVGEKIAIMSDKPQTTRNTIQAVRTRNLAG